MSMLGTKQPTYTDGRTKQSFKDETDINKLLTRADKTGTISHLNKYQARYGDFSGFDYTEAQIMLAQGSEIFDELPAEVRNEFQNSPASFFDYVNDPANINRLETLLPDLAAPGRQFIDPRGNIPADEIAAREASEQPTPGSTVVASVQTPPSASEAAIPPSDDGSSALT